VAVLPNLKIYADGVEIADHDRSTGKAYDTNPGVIIGDWANNDRPWNGEVKSFSAHNRAMSATEVAAAYNGEATPWKYANTSQTSLAVASAANPDSEANLTGHFDSRNSATTTVDSTTWTGSHGTYSIKTVATASNSGLWGNKTGTSGAVGDTKSAVPDGTLNIGRKYRLSYSLKTIAVNGSYSLSQELYTGTTVVDSQSFTGGDNIYNYSVEFTATGTSLYFALVASATATFYVDNWKLVEVGEVAAYTPRGIASDKWYNETKLNGTDATSNHGSVVGATVVGQQRLGNTYSFSNNFTVKGAARIGSDAGGVAIWSDGNHGHVRGLDALGNSYNNLNLGGQTVGIKIVDNGVTTPEVQATRSGGVLKQVARVHNQTITGDNSSANFTILHNLGTTSITVSVREQSSYQHVECAIATMDGSSANSTNNCRVSFATAPGTGVKYDVTVMG